MNEWLHEWLPVIITFVVCYGGYKFWKEFSWKDFLYHKERPAMIRLEELREQYDSVDDLETTVRLVEKNPDVEVFIYCEYQNVAGGEDKKVRIPVKPNSRIWTMLCQEEKNRLHGEMGKTKNIFRLPFHE